MESVPASLQLHLEYSLPLALLTFLIYIPRIPFLIGDFHHYLGCSVTYLLLVIYMFVSVDVVLTEDVVNGVVHLFGALLGLGSNMMVCTAAGDAIKDWDWLLIS